MTFVGDLAQQNVRETERETRTAAQASKTLRKRKLGMGTGIKVVRERKGLLSKNLEKMKIGMLGAGIKVVSYRKRKAN